jgi:putative solute:sodium symporter small subunit
MSLLLSWMLLSFGILFFARELNSVKFFGWSFSFYMAAQGLTLVYVVILAIFSLRSHGIAQRQKNLAASTEGIAKHE